MLKQIVLSCLCFTLFFGACKKDVQVVKYYSHNDSFPPCYTDSLIGSYNCIEYHRYGVMDTNGTWTVKDDSIRTLDISVNRKAFDSIPNAVYISGFQFDDIPCRVSLDFLFSGGMTKPQWSRYLNGAFKNDSIYIYTQMGHLGRVFYNYIGIRKR